MDRDFKFGIKGKAKWHTSFNTDKQKEIHLLNIILTVPK